MVVAAGMDDSSFFTVVANHAVFPKVLDACVRDVDLSHSSASKSFRVGRDEQHALAVVLLRIMTTIHPPATIGKNGGLSCTSVALRLAQLIPPSAVLPICLLFQRVHGRIATTALTCFVMQSPSLLSRLPSAIGSWCDNIDAIACKCVSESRRGRFQRTPGDILALIEATYRATKHVWALLQSLPFVADYIPIDKLLYGLRIVVDVITPLVQYFVLACDSLTTRRAHLSRANAMITNAAVGTAVVTILFSTFSCGESNRREPILPERHTALSEAIAGEIEQNTHGGVPLALLKRGRGSVQAVLAELCSPIDGEKRFLGPTLCAFLNPITAVDIRPAVAASSTGEGTTERFFEVLLLELVHQGVSIEALVRRKFVNADDARRLGASEATVKIAAGPALDSDDDDDAPKTKSSEKKVLAPQTEGKKAPLNGENSAAVSQPDLDEQVALVLSVLPDLNPEAVANALEDYYHRDVEHFIVDATSENLPPHLISSLHAPIAPPAPKAAASAAASQTPILTRRASQAFSGAAAPRAESVWIDGLELVDEHMDRLISSDFHDLADGAADEENGGGGYQIGRSDFDDDGIQHREESTMMTLHTDIGTASSEFFVDDEMKEKIKQLHDMMYDDERDDAQDGGDIVGFVDGNTYDDDDESNNKMETTVAPPNPRRGVNASVTPEVTPAGSPAGPSSALNGSSFPKYASKSKSTRRGGGAGKGAEGGRGRGTQDASGGKGSNDGKGNHKKAGSRRDDRPPSKADLNKAVKRGAFD